jgi:HigB_toxin, RelE-like toxic component of a toxin-antitoxin system
LIEAMGMQSFVKICRSAEGPTLAGFRRVVLNIGGDKYRIVVWIDYPRSRRSSPDDGEGANTPEGDQLRRVTR